MSGRTAPRFAVGARVRIRDIPMPTHHRTPRYVRGRVGAIERYCGAFPNPESLAYGDRDAASAPLYRVRFRQAEIWEGYAGPPSDSLEIEMYEHWLEPVEDGERA